MSRKQKQLFKSTLALGVVCLILCTPIVSLGWGAGGHMIVAKVAFDRLTSAREAGGCEVVGNSDHATGALAKK
jgi:hypothetical protein